MSTKWPLVLAELRPYMELPHPLPTDGHPADPDTSKGVRAAFAVLGPPNPFSPGVRTESIDVAGVRTLVVRPPEGIEVKKGVVIYVIHPGGFIFGAPESEAPLLSTFAEAGYTSISPDYRLAPEHPYPAAHEDVWTVWDWLVGNSESRSQFETSQAILGVDRNNIILFGTSAGSALATYLTFRLAEREEVVRPRLVILDSPHVDSRARPFPSMSPFWKPAVENYLWWSSAGCHNIARYLFGEDSSAAKDEGAPDGVFVNEYPSWKFQELAKNLPPFHLLICELDCIRDSALEFAGKLFTAGVRTDVVVVAGTPHFFVGFFPHTDVARKTKLGYLEAIDRALNGY
ncbi:alpha/beta-hydrolase [Calocera cornea HHB12733]|uniref:Alpha/beta-hydrolase n=1 Tax=Calocera cornea HHB12733 TaxID=1353952 RepID=A0A165FWY9_9BASI|nr:alpha/beta-hydrolase [Calocera cornea HHB12733]